ncbi:hypothetical protein CR532_03290 [Candidatus Borreliella tachyglossi]|uniref:Lipoprotein n=1 Tax=Candidatus Borreliella tachyglossi TaxID=1964448 RepID=A0A2S1LXF8_9SPIR|nr:hypothetical protein [Candidatus Borreliella tachyglossi]AWG42984.1 hypothetical protein CR532_03290 [Candidatus Borreliella tachyglossi]
MKRFDKLLLMSLLFIGCTASSEIHLKDDMSGTISIVVNVNREFENIKKELITTLGGAELAGMPLFPVDEIKKFFDGSGREWGLELLEINRKGDSLKLVVKFGNLLELLKDYQIREEVPIFRVGKKNGKNIINMDINLKNVTRVVDINKEYVNDSLAALLPSEEVPMSEKEYKDVLVYFLSDFTTKASELIDNSSIKVRIKTSRKIQEQIGLKQIDLNTVEFKLSMIRGLSLENPIEMRLVY